VIRNPLILSCLFQNNFILQCRSSINATESLGLILSYNHAFVSLQGESSELEFTFNAELAKLEDKDSEAASQAIQMPSSVNGASESSVSAANNLTSPSEDLTNRIASVKNVWGIGGSLYTSDGLGNSTSSVASATVSVNESLNDQPQSSAGANSAVSAPLSSAAALSPQQQQSQHYYSSVADSMMTASASGEVKASAGMDIVSATNTQLHKAAAEISVPDLGASVSSTSAMDMQYKQQISRPPMSFYDPSNVAPYFPKQHQQQQQQQQQQYSMGADQSNVCKVKPVPQQTVTTATSSASPVGLQMMASSPVAAQLVHQAAQQQAAAAAQAAVAQAQNQHQVMNQVMMAATQVSQQQYRPFQLSSQLFTGQEAATAQPQQQNYFSITAPQPSTVAAAQPAPIAQPTYSQHNLFLTPAQPTDMYTPMSTYRQQQPQQTSQFGQAQQQQQQQQQQQSTIMVSSATSSLMSAAIKPPTAQSAQPMHSQYSKYT
jgi:hypothetical protein